VWDYGPVELVATRHLKRLQSKLRAEHGITDQTVQQFANEPFFVEGSSVGTTSNYGFQRTAGADVRGNARSVSPRRR
jgi:hypothetical protein